MLRRASHLERVKRMRVSEKDTASLSPAYEVSVVNSHVGQVTDVRFCRLLCGASGTRTLDNARHSIANLPGYCFRRKVWCDRSKFIVYNYPYWKIVESTDITSMVTSPQMRDCIDFRQGHTT